MTDLGPDATSCSVALAVRYHVSASPQPAGTTEYRTDARDTFPDTHDSEALGAV